MQIEKLKIDYKNGVSQWERLESTVLLQLGELLGKNSIVLGVPMESRVKSWDSIQEKFDRKTLALDKLADLNDLVGVRVILLFRSDLVRADQLIRDTFEILDSEDTALRLTDAQFGYQSQHYTASLPKVWLAIPTLANLDGLKVEIQVRTLAQHVWAVASHKLQYKHEESVPPPIRRTINRISALLETVDLEFDRVLEERKRYVEASVNADDETELLNVDNLASILTSLLPAQNQGTAERYEELLIELAKSKIKTVAEIKSIWAKNAEGVFKTEASDVKRRANEADYKGTSAERIGRGVFRTHVGLMRAALSTEIRRGTVLNRTVYPKSPSGQARRSNGPP